MRIGDVSRWRAWRSCFGGPGYASSGLPNSVAYADGSTLIS